MIRTTTETIAGRFSQGLNWTRIAVGLFSTRKDMILDACRHTDGKNRKAKCSDQICFNQKHLLQPELRVWPLCTPNKANQVKATAVSLLRKLFKVSQTLLFFIYCTASLLPITNGIHMPTEKIQKN